VTYASTRQNLESKEARVRVVGDERDENGTDEQNELNVYSAKRSFYRSSNAIFGKAGRHASEEVILQLVKSKCMPM